MALSQREVQQIRESLLGIRPGQALPPEPIVRNQPPAPPPLSPEATVFGVKLTDQDARDVAELAKMYIRAASLLDFTIGRTLIESTENFNNDDQLRASDDPETQRIVAQAEGPLGDLVAIRLALVAIFDTQPLRMVRRLVQENFDEIERHIITAYYLDGVRETLGEDEVSKSIEELLAFVGEELVEIVDFAVALSGPPENRIIQAMNPRFRLAAAFAGDFATGAANRFILTEVMTGTGEFGWSEMHVPPLLTVVPVGPNIIKRVLELVRRFAKTRGAEEFSRFIEAGRPKVDSSSPLVKELTGALLRQTGARIPGETRLPLPQNLKMALVAIHGSESPGPARNFVRELAKEIANSSGKGPDKATISLTRLQVMIANAINATKNKSAQELILGDFIAGLAEASLKGAKAVRPLQKQTASGARKAATAVAKSAGEKIPPKQQKTVRASQEFLDQELGLHKTTAAESNLQNEAERRVQAALQDLGITQEQLDVLKQVTLQEAFQAASVRNLREQLGSLAPKDVGEIIPLTDVILLAKRIGLERTTGEIGEILGSMERINSTVAVFDLAPTLSPPNIDRARKATKALFTETQNLRQLVNEARLSSEIEGILVPELEKVDLTLTEVSRRMGTWNAHAARGELELGARVARETPNNIKSIILQKAIIQSPSEIIQQIAARGETVAPELLESLTVPMGQYNRALVRFSQAVDNAEFAKADTAADEMATALRSIQFSLERNSKALPPFSRSVFQAEAAALQSTLNDASSIVAVFRGARRVGTKQFSKSVWQNRLKFVFRVTAIARILAPPVVFIIGIFALIKVNLLLLFVATQLDVLLWGPGALAEATGRDVHGDLQANKRVNNIFWDFREATSHFGRAVRDGNASEGETWLEQMKLAQTNLVDAVELGKTGLTPFAGGFTDTSLQIATVRLSFTDAAVERAQQRLSELITTGVTVESKEAVRVVDGFAPSVTGLLIDASKAISEGALTVAEDAILQAESGLRTMEQQLESNLEEIPERDRQRIDFTIRALKTKINLQRARILIKEQQLKEQGPGNNRRLPGRPTPLQRGKLQGMGFNQAQIDQMTKDEATQKIGRRDTLRLKRIPD